MATKRISSTEAQNNFGKVMDDVTRKHNSYIIQRRGISQVVLVSVDDFVEILSDDKKRKNMYKVIKDLSPEYQIGEVFGIDKNGDK